MCRNGYRLIPINYEHCTLDYVIIKPICKRFNIDNGLGNNFR